MIEFEFVVDVDGLDADALIDSLDTNMTDAMGLAVDSIATDAKHRAPRATGVLANSITPESVTGRFSDDTLVGRVSAGAKHAVYLEFGTGLHGPKGQSYKIRPVRRKALRWPGPGGFSFAKSVTHPGIEPQPFLGPAVDENAEEIAQIFADAIELTFEGIA